MSAATPPPTPVATEFLSSNKNSPPVTPQKQKSISGKGQKISRQNHIQLDEDRQSQLSLDKILKIGRSSTATAPTKRDSPPVIVAAKPIISILVPKTYTSHTLPRKSETPTTKNQQRKKSSATSKKTPDESTVSLTNQNSPTSSTPPPTAPLSPLKIGTSNTSTNLNVSTTISRKSSASSVRFDDQTSHPSNQSLLAVATHKTSGSLGVDNKSLGGSSSMILSSETGLTSLNMYDTSSSINLTEPGQISPLPSQHIADDSGIHAQNSSTVVSPANSSVLPTSMMTPGTASASDLNYNADLLDQSTKRNDKYTVRRILDAHFCYFRMKKTQTSGQSPPGTPATTISTPRRKYVSVPATFLNILHLAIESNANDVLRICLKYGCDPNEPGTNLKRALLNLDTNKYESSLPVAAAAAAKAKQQTARYPVKCNFCLKKNAKSTEKNEAGPNRIFTLHKQMHQMFLDAEAKLDKKDTMVSWKFYFILFFNKLF